MTVAVRESGVIELLKKHTEPGWPMTAVRLAELVGVKSRTAHGWLVDLADKGLIQRRHYGRTAAYRPLTPAEEAKRRRLLATGNPLDELVAKGLMTDHDHASDNGVAR